MSNCKHVEVGPRVEFCNFTINKVFVRYISKQLFQFITPVCPSIRHSMCPKTNSDSCSHLTKCHKLQLFGMCNFGHPQTLPWGPRDKVKSSFVHQNPLQWFITYSVSVQ